ncbi:hypothetical protein L1987_55670 [Smallanthus sonchifolius]|uniref:Uncharacterized protein n=1 Tax=Smallanthus sonchifolius TaxID=185202 RepID=A0ACB9EBM9_9ASTR|nr:hypothetical protein L1987_55670 [Smallanthus sonchifolius]
MTLKHTPANIPSKMAAEAPIKIGTKGTVGSLMMKEIEYFNRLEVRSQKHRLQVPEAAATSTSTGGQPKPKRKKRSNKYMPSICSAIDVEDHNGPRLVSGFGYRTLKADVRPLQFNDNKISSVFSGKWVQNPPNLKSVKMMSSSDLKPQFKALDHQVSTAKLNIYKRHQRGNKFQRTVSS